MVINAVQTAAESPVCPSGAGAFVRCSPETSYVFGISPAHRRSEEARIQRSVRPGGRSDAQRTAPRPALHLPPRLPERLSQCSPQPNLHSSSHELDCTQSRPAKPPRCFRAAERARICKWVTFKTSAEGRGEGPAETETVVRITQGDLAARGEGRLAKCRGGCEEGEGNEGGRAMGGGGQVNGVPGAHFTEE